MKLLFINCCSAPSLGSVSMNLLNGQKSFQIEHTIPLKLCSSKIFTA